LEEEVLEALEEGVEIMVDLGMETEMEKLFQCRLVVEML
jgi:hypothetical protein